MLAAMGVAWVPPLLVKDLIIGWNSIHVRKGEKKAWKTAPLSLLWSILKERNIVVFESEEFSLNKLKRAFVFSLFLSNGNYK